jgi:hypothetical protein
MNAIRRDPRAEIAAIRESDDDVLPNVGLEKSWHGLHYLLTGSADRAEGPLAFLISGGESFEASLGYGAHLLTPDDTAAVDAALFGVSDETLWSRFDPEAMEDAGVYPSIWDEAEDELREEYLSYFHELKQVVRTAAQRRMGLLCFVV